jgi:hypothetical protein
MESAGRECGKEVRKRLAEMENGKEMQKRY